MSIMIMMNKIKSILHITQMDKQQSLQATQTSCNDFCKYDETDTYCKTSFFSGNNTNHHDNTFVDNCGDTCMW